MTLRTRRLIAGFVLGAMGASASPASAGGPDDVATNRRWTERAFSQATQTAADVDQLILVSEGNPGDTKVGRCAAGGPLRLGAKTYTRGIGVNSHSVLRVLLANPGARFLADIGLDRNVDNTIASVAFHVQVGGQDVFATPVLRPKDGARSIDVPLNGAKAFDLIVDEGGDGRNYDQGDWADARVVLQDGTQLWLDDLASQCSVGTDLPFSFVYDGKPSSQLVPTWRRTVQEERIDDTRVRRTLTLTDPNTTLEVRAVCTSYTDTPTPIVTHTAMTPTAISSCPVPV